MEETNAIITESVNVGAEMEPSTGETGGVTGESLFEQYESGASIEELNGLLAQESAHPEDQQPEPAAEQQEAAKQETGQPKEAKPQKRLFTQEEVTRIIGQRIREPQDKYSALLDDLSAVLGVERGQAAETIRRQRLEVEAQKQGVEDVELYAQKKQLEAQTRAIQEQQYYTRLAQDMDQQRQKAGIEDAKYQQMLENPQFILLAKSLYDNPATRETALQTAYQGLYFDEVLKARVEAEKEKVVSSIKAGQQRITEGAAQNNPSVAGKVDVSRLTDKQMEEYMARAQSGETITF